MREFFKRLRPRNYTWAGVLVIIGIVWPMLEVLVTPPFLQANLNPVIFSLGMWVAVVGAAVQIFGYLASFQPGVLGVLGVSIELVGLILSTIAPLTYIITYIVSLIFTPYYSPNFYAANSLVLAIVLLYANRFFLVVPRFRLEAHDITKE